MAETRTPNEPEEWRKVERDAQQAAAEVASDMMRRPGARWLLRPLYRFFKWIERHADAALKEDGWR
jgi:hypothetical protein